MRRLFTELADLHVPVIHFGTDTAGILTQMAAAGGDVIGLDWRVALGDAWARVPDRAIQGNLDPSALLGPWDETAGQARWILAQAGGRPATNPDALRRLVDLVHLATVREPVA